MPYSTKKRFYFHIWATQTFTQYWPKPLQMPVSPTVTIESPEAPACQSQSRFQCQFQTYKCTTSHDPLLCTDFISVVLRYPVISYCIPHVHFRPWQQECPIMAWISDKLWDREDKARQCVLYPDSYTSPQVGSFQFHICFSTSLWNLKEFVECTTREFSDNLQLSEITNRNEHCSDLIFPQQTWIW